MLLTALYQAEFHSLSQKALGHVLGFLEGLIKDDGTRRAKRSWHFRKSLLKITQWPFSVGGIPKISCFWLIWSQGWVFPAYWMHWTWIHAHGVKRLCGSALVENVSWSLNGLNATDVSWYLFEISPTKLKACVGDGLVFILYNWKSHQECASCF